MPPAAPSPANKLAAPVTAGGVIKLCYYIICSSPNTSSSHRLCKVRACVSAYLPHQTIALIISKAIATASISRGPDKEAICPGSIWRC